MYEHDMSQEKAPSKRKLLPEGWRKSIITSCEEKQSKAGNDMFVISVKDIETDYETNVYAIATPGKRWYLRCILDACGISAAADGVYKWNPEEIIDKKMLVLIEHEDNEFINRDGDTIKTKQHRLIDFKKIEEETWDEEEVDKNL